MPTSCGSPVPGREHPAQHPVQGGVGGERREEIATLFLGLPSLPLHPLRRPRPRRLRRRRSGGAHGREPTMSSLERLDSVDVHDPKMTAVRVARLIAAYTRALNYATLPAYPRLEYPGDVYMVLGECTPRSADSRRSAASSPPTSSVSGMPECCTLNALSPTRATRRRPWSPRSRSFVKRPPRPTPPARRSAAHRRRSAGCPRSNPHRRARRVRPAARPSPYRLTLDEESSHADVPCRGPRACSSASRMAEGPLAVAT